MTKKFLVQVQFDERTRFLQSDTELRKNISCVLNSFFKIWTNGSMPEIQVAMDERKLRFCPCGCGGLVIAAPTSSEPCRIKAALERICDMNPGSPLYEDRDALYAAIKEGRALLAELDGR